MHPVQKMEGRAVAAISLLVGQIWKHSQKSSDHVSGHHHCILVLSNHKVHGPGDNELGYRNLWLRTFDCNALFLGLRAQGLQRLCCARQA